jgi:hypothetical protein
MKTQNRWKHSPKGSSWGEFGPNDERGRMNLVTKEKVLQGVAEVREGLTFCLSLPLDYPGGLIHVGNRRNVLAHPVMVPKKARKVFAGLGQRFRLKRRM